MKTTMAMKETNTKTFLESEARPEEKSLRTTTVKKVKSMEKKTTTTAKMTIVRIRQPSRETLERDTKMIESLSIIPNN